MTIPDRGPLLVTVRDVPLDDGTVAHRLTISITLMAPTRGAVLDYLDNLEDAFGGTVRAETREPVHPDSPVARRAQRDGRPAEGYAVLITTPLPIRGNPRDTLADILYYDPDKEPTP